jgi:hypothetical protein
MTKFTAWQPGEEACWTRSKSFLDDPVPFSQNITGPAPLQSPEQAFASKTNRSGILNGFNEKMAQQRTHEGFFGKHYTNPSVSPAEVIPEVAE